MIRIFFDQCGNRVTLAGSPQRVISLVPSQTELLFDLGLEKQVVGITKFCVHPSHWKKEKIIIGGTKNFNFELIRSLQPDLIIGNKEENYREGIETLQREFPVWMSNIVTLMNALDMIEVVGDIFFKKDKALDLREKIFQNVFSIPPGPQKRALYLIWRNPWMGAGQETFINTVLQWVNLTNVLETIRYPELSNEDIRSLSPEFILLSSEPYPFKESHISELQELCPRSRIILVDGEMFSWYGSRMLIAPDYLKSLDFSLSGSL